MAKTTDMTAGKPLGLLAAFALPMILGNIFQQFYNLADSMVVGRLIGVEAFAAVGASGFLSWMVLDVILGFTQGFGVLFAQRFGAGDRAGLRRAVAMAVLCTAALGVLFTAAGLLALRPALEALQTPADIIDSAELYLRWIFAGTLVNAFYNTAASLLRSLGNSKAPLIAMIFSTVLNILLDLLFVAVFHLGVAGVAVATVLSQLFALGYCVIKLKGIAAARVHKADFALDPQTLRELMRLSSPPAFRNAVISFGGLIIQWAVNGYGTLFVAGVTAAKKYFGVMEIIGGALDGSLATYTAQNFGKKNISRIGDGMRCALRIALISSVSISALSLLFGRSMVSLFVTGTAAEIAEISEIGYNCLTAISFCLPSLYLLYIFRSGLQGMGKTLTPMLSGFMELALRIACILLLPPLLGVWGVYFSDGLGWIGAALLLGFSYYSSFKKLGRQYQGQKEPRRKGAG